ncbi:MAG: flavodoxin domain-containing protein [Actinomycetes bacterium]
MRVLVTAGSKYGSTREIAHVIAAELAAQGFEVDCLDAHEVLTVNPYDAIVVGSAVYGGLWRRDAEEFIAHHADVLVTRDVWTFSVGLETVVTPGEGHDEAKALGERIGARGHMRFTGALDPDRINEGERALLAPLNPPVGDFRDMARVREWAQEIGAQMAEIASL